MLPYTSSTAGGSLAVQRANCKSFISALIMDGGWSSAMLDTLSDESILTIPVSVIELSENASRPQWVLRDEEFDFVIDRSGHLSATPGGHDEYNGLGKGNGGDGGGKPNPPVVPKPRPSPRVRAQFSVCEDQC